MNLLEAYVFLSPALAGLFLITTVGFGVALAWKPTRRGITRLAPACAECGRCAALAAQQAPTSPETTTTTGSPR